MPVPHHDLVHLVSLIEAAKAQAVKLGAAGSVVDHLDQALSVAQALDAEGGRANEGLRPEDLTTDNDK